MPETTNTEATNPEPTNIEAIASRPDRVAGDLERRIVDLYQRDFPLEARPYAAIAERLGVSEASVLDALRRLDAQGALSRIGPVVRPNRAGASTLAAMAVPQARLDDVAELVSACETVNHNYEREHRLNLWFVVAAADRAAVDATLRDIEARTGLPVIDLPLEAAYHIDLGFKVQWTD